MSFFSVESSLALAAKDLDAVIERRETLIKNSRDVISLCSKAIISVHTLNFEEAKRLSKQARSKLVELRKIAGADLQKYLLTPEQEFVEATVMLSLAEKHAIPTIARFGVSPSSYILGLLDSIGEMKRSVLDGIRQNNPVEAESLFGAMENLYVLLSPFSVYDHVVPGIRRKLDVARMLVEDVRSTITEERRRLDFMASISDLSSKLGHEKVAVTK